MKIKLIEEKIDYVDREIDVEFPFYFHIDLSNGHDCENCADSGNCEHELEIENELLVNIFGVMTETKSVRIVEKFDPEFEEFFYDIQTIDINLEHLEQYNLDEVLLNEDLYSTENEFEEAKDRYYNWLEEAFNLDFEDE